jgi:tetratricopeptide (TPR) repeat protein
MGRYEEAADAYTEAIRLEPTLVEAYRNLGFAYYKSGQKKKALKAFRTTVTFLPESAEAHFNLGMTYIAIGDRRAALIEYTAVKDKDSQLAARLYQIIFKDKLLDAKKR